MSALKSAARWFAGLSKAGKWGVSIGALVVVSVLASPWTGSNTPTADTNPNNNVPTWQIGVDEPTATTQPAPTTTQPEPIEDNTVGDTGLTCEDIGHLGLNAIENYREATTGMIHRPAKAERALNDIARYKLLGETYCGM